MGERLERAGGGVFKNGLKTGVLGWENGYGEDPLFRFSQKPSCGYFSGLTKPHRPTSEIIGEKWRLDSLG